MLLPLGLLSLVFAVILMVVIANNQVEMISPAPLLIAGLLIYAGTLLILGHAGFLGARELEELSVTDSLSQLPNRRALHQHIQEALKTKHEIAIALIDLDSFKQVNDRHGHAAGDELIRQCGAILREYCEPEARCFRLGGDEFAAVMIGPVAGTILEGMCRSVLDRLNASVVIDQREIVIGASVGLARSTPDERLPSSELLRRSDVAMYMSKRSGRMRCTWFNETFDQRREAMRELDDEMRRGLAAEEFSVIYQPLVDADTRDIVAVEALVRWNRPDGRNVGPHIFIPVAEESGLINAIGHYVLRRAVADAMQWPDIVLSVNISAAQLRNPEFPIQLGEVLEETGFPPERLELEITETCLVLDPVIAARTLALIRGFGVHIALDDFGTGYASIGFLRQFRFEKLKLDRSLVVQAENDEGSRAMMVSSVTVARALKMGVTAEGVETIEQANLARTAGCDQIQGWLYYRAMPASEIDQLITDQRASQAAQIPMTEHKTSGNPA